MDIKLIVSDLDGTLLREDKTLSPYTRRVLERCRARGALFFPATARPPRTLDGWIDGLAFDGAICHNGGVVLLGGETLWERGIPPELAGRTALRLQEELPGARVSAEVGGTLYANFDAGAFWPGVAYVPTDFRAFPDRAAEKLIVGLAPGREEAEATQIKALLPPSLRAQVSEGRAVTIQPADVEKGAALLDLCRRLGIPPGQSAAFGDDWNDLSLLRAAGVGVAVANALPEVRAAADQVCRSNQEDGPARWLEERMLS